MDDAERLRWFDTMREVLDRSHLWTPEEVAPTVNAAVARLGLRTRIHLVDHEQVALHALAEPGRETPPPAPVDGSLAGRAFVRVESTPAGSHRWWVPMVDGTDRLGVIEFVASTEVDPADPQFVRHCEQFSGLIGHLISVITARGDGIDRTRRTQPMSPAAELLSRLLPPLTSSWPRSGPAGTPAAGSTTRPARPTPP